MNEQHSVQFYADKDVYKRQYIATYLDTLHRQAQQLSPLTAGLTFDSFAIGGDVYKRQFIPFAFQGINMYYYRMLNIFHFRESLNKCFHIIAVVHVHIIQSDVYKRQD